ncbi:hypothetical protein Y032_0251g199 [Ancylostoma ceylanicum]|uniref:Uncharacterized protein n=1 Tax=Ancylostoma ceylanicum TaxID=53326 RepID=A0A016SCW9_9BILA|nr:hypothetical protein Y032_0251g199 [Ancylostoma ceylanicum]
MPYIKVGLKVGLLISMARILHLLTFVAIAAVDASENPTTDSIDVSTATATTTTTTEGVERLLGLAEKINGICVAPSFLRELKTALNESMHIAPCFIMNAPNGNSDVCRIFDERFMGVMKVNHDWQNQNHNCDESQAGKLICVCKYNCTPADIRFKQYRENPLDEEYCARRSATYREFFKDIGADAFKVEFTAIPDNEMDEHFKFLDSFLKKGGKKGDVKESKSTLSQLHSPERRMKLYEGLSSFELAIIMVVWSSLCWMIIFKLLYLTSAMVFDMPLEEES